MRWFAAAFLLLLSPALPAQTSPAPVKLTLEEAIAIAHKNNPRLSIERVQALIGDESVNMARSGLFPTIAANATAAGALADSRLAAGALNNPIIFNRMAAGVSFSQLLTDFGRTSNIVEGTRLRSQSQRESVSAAQSLLTLAVHRAFFSVLRAQRVVQVADQTIAARTVAFEQVSTLARSGLRSILDAGFAEVNLSEAKLARLAAVNEQQSALADLSMTLGYARPQSFEVQDIAMPNSGLTPVGRAEEMIAEAMRSRPDVSALRLERDAAERLAAAEHKLNRPVLSALANAGVAPVHDDRLRNTYAAAGVNLNVPVFNGGLFRARQQEADLRVQAAELRVRDLESRIANEITAAVLAAQTAFDRVDLTEQLLRQATSTADLARERYNLGLSSIVELSQAELNQTAAEIRAATAKYEYLLQRVVVDYQSGKLR